MTNKKKKTENNEGKEQEETSSNCQKWVYTCSCFIVILGVFSGIYMSVPGIDGKFPDQRAAFVHFDTNGDGVITSDEFKSIFAFLNQISSESGYERNDKEQTTSQESSQTITLKTKFTPLDLKSFESEEEYGNKLLEQPENLKGLVQWTKASKTKIDIPVSDCGYFLPPAQNVHVGNVWGLYHATDYELSHNRHFPEETEGVEQFLTSLLQAFHPRPFTVTRFGPKGGYAALRAKAGDIMDIHFRFHAEFQLNEPPVLPFWFTPAQFTGNIIINSRTKEVYDFNLYVPNDRVLNVDMEWLNRDTGEESLHVHIGHMADMKLSMDKETDVEIEWNKEIAEKEVKSLLEKAFYPFKKVDYYKFEEAFDKAALEKKLVHSSGRSLRDGPLATPPMVKFLKENFISSWSLLEDLKELQSSDNATVASRAKTAVDTYTFPVEIFVYNSDGKVLVHKNLNDIMAMDEDDEELKSLKIFQNGIKDSFTYKYIQVLKEGVEVSKKN